MSSISSQGTKILHAAWCGGGKRKKKKKARLKKQKPKSRLPLMTLGIMQTFIPKQIGMAPI